MTTDKTAWFLVRCEEGREKLARDGIMKRAQALDLGDRITVIAIPTKGVIAIRKGKKTRQTEFPFGYLVIEMLQDDITRQLVLETPGVVEFVTDRAMNEGQVYKALDTHEKPAKWITIKWEKYHGPG